MKSYFLIVAVIGFVSSLPVKNASQNHSNPKVNITHGDMILTTRQKSILFRNTKVRNGVKNPSERWPDAIVYYTYSSSIPIKHRNLITESLGVIEKATCVRFKHVSSSAESFVRITNNGESCFSYVGFQQEAGQELNLGRGCMYKGTIIHEFLHALGFYHQQSSADRNDYIEIHKDNIESGHEDNYEKFSDEEVTSFGFPYDYGSIMHYDPFYFSVNGKPVMTARKSGGEVMGQRDGLSDTDIGKIKKMYNCP